MHDWISFVVDRWMFRWVGLMELILLAVVLLVLIYAVIKFFD